jgi:ABC-type transporter MlaC component
MDRTAYFRKYREEHREYYAEKTRKLHAENKRLYGAQARAPTRKFFTGVPITKISVKKKPVVVSFD